MLPHPSLLPYTKSNEPLPQSLIEPLDLYLGFLNRRIEELDTDIQDKRHERHLQDVQIGRNQLLEDRSIYQALAAPSRQVPPEILAIILNEALTRSDGQNSLTGRAGTMSMPDLWRHLDIDIWGELAGASPANLASEVKTWFMRGGSGAGLAIQISGWCYTLGEAGDKLHWLDQDELNFRTVVFNHPVEGQESISFLHALPLLNDTRNLSLGLRSRRWHVRNLACDPSLQLSHIFPNLESLSLHAEFPAQNMACHESLVSLHLNNPPYSTFYDIAGVLPGFPLLQELILRFDNIDTECGRCTSYRHCTIAGDAGSFEPNPIALGVHMTGVPLPVALTSLKRLVVTGGLPRRIFTAFTLPILEQFQFIGPMRYADGTFDELRHFIARTDASRLTLDLYKAILSVGDLDMVLSNIPHLGALYLGDPEEHFPPSSAQGISAPINIDIGTILFAGRNSQTTFDIWSEAMTRRITSSTPIEVYFEGEGLTKELGGLSFTGIGRQEILEMTEDRFPLLNHDCTDLVHA
ncbi:hypothetical protein BKA70DRAFT_1263728 [Coprinopsis sp. MPI-PUGE-AT-0042]|nr:hypothetical protein BKA70DRAFT_1263728 [Coprinopsis sp. MPI-PUGE-AT-0042]